MKNKKRLIFVILALLGLLFVWNIIREKRYVTDSDFVMQENALSPDGRHRIITFRIDAGAFGDGIGRAAVTPPEYQKLNLADYEIPLCYESFGWTEQSELIVSVEKNLQNTSTLCTQSDYDLKTGDMLQGVKVMVVNEDEFLLRQGLEKTKDIHSSTVK